MPGKTPKQRSPSQGPRWKRMQKQHSGKRLHPAAAAADPNTLTRSEEDEQPQPIENMHQLLMLSGKEKVMLVLYCFPINFVIHTPSLTLQSS